MTLGLIRGWMACCGLAAVTAATMGCHMASPVSATQAAATKVVQVREQQDGQTVEATVGDEVDVQLPAQMGTGFSWQMRAPDGGVVMSLGAPELKTGNGALPGGAEMQVFRVKVQGVGEAVLRFEYRRPWEADTAAAKTFTVKIHAAR